MRIHDLLDDENILPQLRVSSKQEAIKSLIQTLSMDINSNAKESCVKAVLERESIMSTGVGKGLAIPHGKARGLDKTYAAFAKLDPPIDYDAIDGEPVQLIFLLVGPETQNSLHIKMLSRISRLLNSASFREKLIESSTSHGIREAFRLEEEQFIRI
ncbi:MAG: PTS sugar transporter subunit IIA [Balneolales bacterium]